MARRSTRRESAAQAAPGTGKGAGGAKASGAEAGCTVTVCRGCCCGTTARHPDVDHGAQLVRLREGVGEAGRVRAVPCLDACDHSNVVVVSPSPAGRLAGGRPVWLGWVLADDMLDEITEWVRAGGPGIAEPPGTLDLQEFAVSRRVREGLRD
ncbi:(2Fe-2S) ferredoxin domain-containing protein [Kitasatospora sp. HPMI-4]|uniref:(2Fe-2S) ferredoxin domain-containing protein n=1 Tax=Kitasatospora sp. HPMI-4 TaxID=3448443 RepID=UPI003F1BE081